ncbi:MAG: CoA transferase, partial [Pseudomonadales bacterium]|nr:CoA transferase [Pseudomonadales bacterium]
MMTSALAGLTVLDLSSGPAGALTTMILSAFGADVPRYEDPVHGALNASPASPMLSRGKRSSRIPVHDAVRDADIVVITRPHGFSGCGYEELERINPTLVYCEISADASGADIPLYEGVVAAMAGRMKSLEGILPEPGPIFPAVQVATHATAQNAVSGILAAVYERNRSGRGQRVATSLLHGLMPYDQGAILGLQIRERRESAPPLPDPFSIMPTLNYHPVQCADGKWLQLGNLLPHLFASFMKVIGLEALMEKLPDERETVRDEILRTMQTRTRDEWMQLFIEDGGVAAHAYQTPEEALDDPDLVDNGHVIELDGIRQLGPLARLAGTPAVVGLKEKQRAWPDVARACIDGPDHP